MTVECLKNALALIENYFGRPLSTDERTARSQIYAAALKDIPDDVAAAALTKALTVCRYQNQLLVDWCAEIRKLQSAGQPTANDLWTQAIVAARKIERNQYYATHGGLVTATGKLTAEDFRAENRSIFGALPAAVREWAGSPAGLVDALDRSNADLLQYVKPGFVKAGVWEVVPVMPIIAIDPGNVQSGYCVIDQKTLRPLEFGKIDNEELLKKLESAAKQGWRWAVIEMVASYGMSVGRDVFDTTVWIGRFYQVLSSRCSVRMMCRIEEKKHICHDSRANDTAIRRALIDRFAAHDLKNGKGTKKAPDFFYGFKADVWAAYALGLTAIENRENDYKFSTT